MRVIFVVLSLFLLPQGEIFAAQNVVINEIAWMGTLPREGESTQAAANNEWIELWNSGDTPVSLEGWKITSQDGAPDIMLSGAIPSRGYFLLERGSDEVVPSVHADILYPFKNNALSNDGERLFLKDAAGGIVDEVNASSGWMAGDNVTKETMQRSGSIWVTATSTPRAINYGLSTATPVFTPAAPSTSSPNYGPVVFPSIKSYAGEDKIVAAGSDTEFIGSALGLEDKPLDGARLLWNFGDGEFKEGRVVSHIFQVPGTYLVGLHVSSGIYAASDYLSVKVIPNRIQVISVIGGEQGFIKLSNPEDVDIDIGGWNISDPIHSFTIPFWTKIKAHAEIALANDVTGMLQDGAPSALTLRYPNTAVALRWNPSPQVIPPENSKEIAERKIGPFNPKSDENKEAAKEESSEFADVARAHFSATNVFLPVAVLISLGAALGFLTFRRWKNRPF